MTIHPGSEGFSVPAASDAQQMLRDIAPVARRSRRLTRDAAAARPLLAWGLAWMAGAVLYQYVAGPAGAILGSVPAIGAVAVTWLMRSRDVRLPAERRFALIWLGFLASSPLLVAVAAPPNARLMVVFLASLWAVGMVLYGIGTGDVPLAVVGLVTAGAAAAARIAAPGAAMLIVGIVGGLGMALLGASRMRLKE
jgi:hypothetical protein